MPDACMVPLTYTNFDYGQNFWNYFSINFVNAINNYVPTDALNETGNFLFAKEPFRDVAHIVLLSQPIFIVFFWFGVIISVFSFVGAIAFLFPCARHWNTKNVSSKCMTTTGLALAIVSFCFIFFGTIMYLVAHISSVANSRTSMDSVYKNIDSFTSTIDQNACFLQQTLDPMWNRSVLLPNTINSLFEKETGLQNMAKVNATALAEPLGSAELEELVNQILGDLGDVAAKDDIKNDQKAADQVNTAIHAMTEIQREMNDLSTEIIIYGNDIVTFQLAMQKYVTDESHAVAGTAKDNITREYARVENTIQAVTLAMARTSSLIHGVSKQIDFARSSADAVANGWLVPRWLMIAPLLFAVVAALVAIGFGVYFYFNKHDAAQKGISCALLTLAVILLALTSVVLIPAMVGMAYGYSAQTSLDPFFYDYNLKGLYTMGSRLPNFNIPAMKGSSVVTAYADVMTTCKHEDIPFFTAVVVRDDVIDEQAIAQSINSASLFASFETSLVHSHSWTIDGLLQTTIYNSLMNFKALPDLDLTAAKEADPADIEFIIAEIDYLSYKVSAGGLDDWIAAYNYHDVYSFTDLTNETMIKIILGNEMNSTLVDMDKSMQEAAKTLYSDLYTGGESCKNLYKSYADAGDLATVDTVGYVQGMWTSVGLCALFFVPLAISLLFLSNAFRIGHEDVIFTSLVKPIESSPAPVVQHQVTHSSPPAAPRPVEAAYAVPVRPASRDAWSQQTIYVSTDSFAPKPVQQFVDPLAYRRVGSPTEGLYASSSRH